MYEEEAIQLAALKAAEDTNRFNVSGMDGNDVEVFSIKSLSKIYNGVRSKFDKEHVTTYLRRNKKKLSGLSSICKVYPA